MICEYLKCSLTIIHINKLTIINGIYLVSTMMQEFLNCTLLISLTNGLNFLVALSNVNNNDGV